MQQITGEHPCWSVISIKLFCVFIEIKLRYGFSSVNFFRTPFSKNTSGWLLLILFQRELKSFFINFTKLQSDRWEWLKQKIVMLWLQEEEILTQEVQIFPVLYDKKMKGFIESTKAAVRNCSKRRLFKLITTFSFNREWKIRWEEFQRNNYSKLKE